MRAAAPNWGKFCKPAIEHHGSDLELVDSVLDINTAAGGAAGSRHPVTAVRSAQQLAGTGSAIGVAADRGRFSTVTGTVRVATTVTVSERQRPSSCRTNTEQPGPWRPNEQFK